MTTNEKRTLPLWMTLKCGEKLVRNPASLFSQAVAAVLSARTVDGYTELEVIQHLNFPTNRKSEPVQVIYKGNCTLSCCWNGSFLDLHDHTESLGHYKFWNSKCRRSRKCIEHVFPYHPETTILTEINERKRIRRISETQQFSCKRRLFE